MQYATNLFRTVLHAPSIKTPKLRRRSAFSLVEVMVAMGIASFGLITMVGLLPIGVTSGFNAIGKTAATSLATDIVNQLSVAATRTTTTNGYSFAIPTAGGNATSHTLFFNDDGAPTGQIDANATVASRYRATVQFTPPSSNQKTATQVAVLITWPAEADAQASAAPVHAANSIEVTTFLNCN